MRWDGWCHSQTQGCDRAACCNKQPCTHTDSIGARRSETDNRSTTDATGESRLPHTPGPKMREPPWSFPIASCRPRLESRHTRPCVASRIDARPSTLRRRVSARAAVSAVCESPCVRACIGEERLWGSAAHAHRRAQRCARATPRDRHGRTGGRRIASRRFPPARTQIMTTLKRLASFYLRVTSLVFPALPTGRLRS